MSTGFNNDYEEAIIRGNLSIEPSDNPLVSGDGSVEIASKLYVDYIKEYTPSQGILVGDVQINFDSMFVPFSQASTGWTSGAIVSNGGITIRNTTECTSPSSGGALTVFGGASIVKGLCMGGHIDMGGSVIENLILTPTLPGHATSKDYVDSIAGRAYGNYTTGQVIIAETVGTAIRGFDTFTFDGTSLILGPNTTFNIQSTLGNSFTTLGGGTFGGPLSISDNRVTNVAPPINGTDAVNLDFLQNYVTDSLEDCTIIDPLLIYERGLTLTHTITPLEIPLLEFSGDDINFFECYVYTQSITQSFSLHILRGFFDGVIWTLHVQYPGQPSIVTYQIQTTGTLGTITYINPLSNPVYIKYRKFFELKVTDPGYQVFNAVTSGSYTNVTGLQYSSSTVKGFKLIIVSETSGFIISGVYDTTIGWSIVTALFGAMSDIKFGIDSITGQIQYKNTGSAQVISYKEITSISDGAPLITFTNSTNTPTDTTIAGHNANRYKTFTYYLYIKTAIAASFYTIYGVFYNGPGVWSIHSQYVGTLSDIRFSIVTAADVGTLYYTNSGILDAYAKYSTEFPPVYRNPICVNKGGTGATDLLPYAILRGNGQRHILATDEIVYYNNQLVLNQLSSIYLTNVSSSFTSLGSGLFGGDFSIGGTTNVNGNAIINVLAPVNGGDAVNKDYLGTSITTVIDELTQFTQGQVLVGGSDGNVIVGFPEMTYLSSGTLVVTSISTGNTSVNGTLNVNSHAIINVLSPVNNGDVVNKGYLETSITTSRDELTQFTQGQVLVGGSDGNVIVGFPEMTYLSSGTLLVTSISTGNTSVNGTLNVNGYAITNVLSPVNNGDAVNKGYLETSITTSRDELTQFTQGQMLVGGSDGNVIVGFPEMTYSSSGTLTVPSISTEGLDMNGNNVINVLAPVNGGDAVNKEYLTSWFECGFYGSNDDSEFETTKILTSSNTPVDVEGLLFTEHAFYTFVYVRTVLSGKSAFYIIKGFKNSSNIWTINTEYTGDPFGELSFSITPGGQIQYTNTDTNQIIWLKYRMFYKNDSLITVVPITLVPITLKVYPNNSNFAFKTNITSSYNNNIIYAYRNDTVWHSELIYFGISGPSFSTSSTGISGELQYTSTVSDSLYIKDISNIETVSSITQSLTYIPLLSFTFEPEDSKSFYLLLYSRNSSKAGLVEITGVYSESLGWRLNKRYIGDNLLNLAMNGNNLEYTTLDAEDPDVGYFLSIPPLTTPLCVIKGGTGAREFTPTALLIGNGTLPVYTTSKLTFGDDTLRVYGDVLINDADITPFTGSISLLNNVLTPLVIPEVQLSTFKGCVITLVTRVSTNVSELDEMFELRAINTEPGWITSGTSFGDATGISFGVESSGNLSYMSSNTINWESTLARFKVDRLFL